MLTDSFGRKITYLRLSVTDRCNFRCVYCLPEIYSRFSPLENVLTDDEIVRLISLFANLGLSRVRITGGEPLLRPGIVNLVDRLHAIPGISDLSLSTNGFLLKKMASDLARAGIAMVLYPLSAFRAMSAAARDVYDSIRNDGTQKAVVDRRQTRVELYEVLNYAEYERRADEALGR